MYVGTIRHRRFAERSHAFKHRIALAYRAVEHAPAPVSCDAVYRLATPRGFNPVALYYCFTGGELSAIVAEVTNTPWGEQHTYVLGPRGGRLDKAFHVSPFMAMDHVYDVRATAPGETLSMHIESYRDGRLAFDATLNLRRRPLRRRALLGASLRTLALIYAHGLVLKLKGVTHFPRPTEASR